MTSTEVNGWILTDDDSSQYLKPIGEGRYDCIEVRRLQDDKYAVARATLDLDVLPREELESVVETYYDSVDEVFGTYGELGAAQVMAECLFEQLPKDEMDFYRECSSELGALEMVQMLIRGEAIDDEDE